MRYAPYLVGLAGCLLPDAYYSLANQGFSTRIIEGYSGWSVLILLLILLTITFRNIRKQKTGSPFFTGLTGIYLLGFALFRTFQTLTMYSGAGKNSLAQKLEATAIPREGLLLLAVSGVWLLVAAIRNRNLTFSTPVE